MNFDSLLGVTKDERAGTTEARLKKMFWGVEPQYYSIHLNRASLKAMIFIEICES
jgi:hypothetical protein